MGSRTFSVRLPEDVYTPYVEMAELMGVPAAAVLRDTLAEAAPSVRELLEAARAAQSGDAAGLLATMRAFAERHQVIAAGAAGELAEMQNELKVEAAKKQGRKYGRPVRASS